MKAPKEYKRWVKRLVSRFGKKNGVVPSALFDSPSMDRKLQTNKRLVKNTFPPIYIGR